MTLDLGRWLDFFCFLSLAVVLHLHASDYVFLIFVLSCDNLCLISHDNAWNLIWTTLDLLPSCLAQFGIIGTAVA
jgi:hypothetical protein